MQKRRLEIIKKFFSLAFLIAGFFVFSNSVFAATLNLNPSVGTFSVGDTISVNLVVGTDVSVNAISAILNYSNTTLSLTSISKSGSIITLWPVGPTFSNQNGSASIEGVILSGFSGSYGKVATLNFKAVKEGSAYIRFSGGSVLANDGQGTNTLLASNGSNFEIKKRVENQTKEPVQISTVNTIKIEEIKDSSLEDGKSQFLITTPRPAKNNSFNIQIDTEKVFVFNDDGSHLYETPVLGSGNHTIRISAYDQNNILMSGVTEFITVPKYIEEPVGPQISKITDKNTQAIVINMAVIIVILILLLVFILIIMGRNRKKLHKRLQESRNAIAKTFSSLEDDEEKENMLIRKLRSNNLLTDEEEVEINHFSRNIHSAEKNISESLNSIEGDE